MNHFTQGVFLLLIMISCKSEIVEKRFYPRNDHEAYWNSLKQANLLETALGKEWNQAAEKSLSEAYPVDLPYQELFTIDERKPDALSFVFELKRGQSVSIDIQQIKYDSSHLFVDVFKVYPDTSYRMVASADSAHYLEFEPRQDAKYILRMQPELLRGGNYKVSIQISATLDFPVSGKTPKAIQSVFGDPRDGGRREHHGVDIFAKRHTPIVAPCDGYVRFVGERGIGGKVIWLYDSKRGQSLYFAHLQDQLVNSRTYVKRGDTLGTVGNTGNARTTPPHLHFGIYSNGPIDPYHHIVNPRSQMASLLEFQLEDSVNLRENDVVSERLKIVGVNGSRIRVANEHKAKYVNPDRISD